MNRRAPRHTRPSRTVFSIAAEPIAGESLTPSAQPGGGSGVGAAGSTEPNPAEASSGPDWLSEPARFLSRDLSWLEFNARVLAIAQDVSTPLLERVRFLSIFSSNLDEFFMKRVGRLRESVQSGRALPGAEAYGPADLLFQVRERVQKLLLARTECWRKSVRPALASAGIHILHWEDLSGEERAEADHWFTRNVFPILTPLAVDSGHRFPFISNQSLSLALLVRRPGATEAHFARVKVPDAPARLLRLGSALRFVSVREIIERNLGELFPGMEVLQTLGFRVTRDAELDPSDEQPDDLLEAMERQLKERRFADVVRLEAPAGGGRILRFLADELAVGPEDIYEVDGPLDYTMLDTIADLDIGELHFPRWAPSAPRALEDQSKSIFAQIRAGDILLHHPYDSFEASVERFVREAAADPKVLCIKQSLYRTSGDGAFVNALARAAESGKQVAVLVELRARFDEARNISWARKLEDAGAHVAYGVVGLKTHTKMALVVRQEAAGLRCYAHVGTGNYNSRTASIYEDLSLLTCNPEITEDVVDLFNLMTGRSRQTEFRRLLVAPVAMKQRFLELIEREAAFAQQGQPARIVAKMNQLEDRGVMDALYRASQAGVPIDLLVRGFCCLRPGVPGLSENIRVRSIVGRFLEHSRIFHFGAGRADPLDGEFFIGSADWMYRNLQTRVEAAVPLESRGHRESVWRILKWSMEDTRLGWDMQGDGSFRSSASTETAQADDRQLGLHSRLMAAAVAGTSLVRPQSD